MELNTLLYNAVQAGASDVHLKLGRAPMVRLDGAVQELPGTEPLTDADLDSYLRTVTAIAPQRYDMFQQTGDLDIAYTAGDLPRFRVNAFRQRGAVSFALRVIPKKVPRFEDLGLPTGIERLANEHRGLVLVTGATGSGKTTTLAPYALALDRELASLHRASWQLKRALDRWPRASWRLARSALVWRTVERLLLGELGSPGEQHGIARAPLRALALLGR